MGMGVLVGIGTGRPVSMRMCELTQSEVHEYDQLTKVIRNLQNKILQRTFDTMTMELVDRLEHLRKKRMNI